MPLYFLTTYCQPPASELASIWYSLQIQWVPYRTVCGSWHHVHEPHSTTLIAFDQGGQGGGEPMQGTGVEAKVDAQRSCIRSIGAVAKGLVEIFTRK